jgi:hypothetical protein
MDSNRTKRFDVIVKGKRVGAVDKWKHIPLTISSCWDDGSDAEKFEVLAAIRRTYDADDRSDIHGTEGQTPAQVGRCEGFRELTYQRVARPSAEIIIVPPLMRYLRLVPQSPMADAGRPTGHATADGNGAGGLVF